MDNNLTVNDIINKIHNSNKILHKVTLYHNIYSDALNANYSYWNGNYTDIVSEIICNAGRFTLYKSSDIIITLDLLKESLKYQHLNNNHYFVFAMRENGVDDILMLSERTSKIYRNGYYRRILAIELEECTNLDTQENTINMILKEITL